MAGRPYKNARERTNYNFSTALMHELLKEEIAKGRSRRVAAADLPRGFNRNLKAHGLKPITGNAVLKRIERWQRAQQ
jgi:hypothetical protein